MRDLVHECRGRAAGPIRRTFRNDDGVARLDEVRKRATDLDLLSIDDANDLDPAGGAAVRDAARERQRLQDRRVLLPQRVHPGLLTWPKT